MSWLVKILYILNLTVMFAGMIYVSILQGTGALNCPSIAVTFPDDIWQDAIVVSDSGETEQPVDLIYSYFNGVYKRNGTHDGLPVYIEQSKVLDQPYQVRTPAEIKYCKSEESWVFMHPNIRKSESDGDQCPWLLKSPMTTEYDLLSVTGAWTVWAGSYKQGGAFRAVCSECSNAAECNYHGQCMDGKCECTSENFFGNHCEHKRPCRRLRGDLGDIWIIRGDADGDEILAYDRPTYTYQGGFNLLPDGQNNVIVYTGSRWFAMEINASYSKGNEGRQLQRQANSTNNPDKPNKDTAREFHAFWSGAYNKFTTFVSDPSTDTSPIAVDFYNISDRGPRYGPLGQLTPLNTPPGSGYFECDD